MSSDMISVPGPLLTNRRWDDKQDSKLENRT